MRGNVFEDLVGFTDIPREGQSTQRTLIGLSTSKCGDWVLIDLSFAKKSSAHYKRRVSSQSVVRTKKIYCRLYGMGNDLTSCEDVGAGSDHGPEQS